MQTINLVALGRSGLERTDLFRVASLTNRLEPRVGTRLTTAEVESLLKEAAASNGQLKINIREK